MFSSLGPAENGFAAPFLPRTAVLQPRLHGDWAFSRPLPPLLAKIETMPYRSQLKQPLKPYLIYTGGLGTGSTFGAGRGVASGGSTEPGATEAGATDAGAGFGAGAGAGGAP